MHPLLVCHTATISLVRDLEKRMKEIKRAQETYGTPSSVCSNMPVLIMGVSEGGKRKG